MGILNLFNRKKPAGSPAERYLQHLNNIFQQEPLLFMEESHIPEMPGVTAIVYENIPKKGYITAFTYGLSLVKHPKWKYGRAELCISVASADIRWGRVVAYVANQLRGACPFTYGEVINFEQRISDDSGMDAFFVFAPSTIGKESYLDIDLGLDYKVNIASLYPIYSEEIGLFNEIGLEAFWHHEGFDNYVVSRPKMV